MVVCFVDKTVGKYEVITVYCWKHRSQSGGRNWTDQFLRFLASFHFSDRILCNQYCVLICFETNGNGGMFCPNQQDAYSIERLSLLAILGQQLVSGPLEKQSVYNLVRK